MDIQVPERAEYIRVILTEMNRLSSHFMFMGAFGIDSGLFGTSFTYAFREREWLQDVFEEVSGDRLMYAYFRVGGLAWEVPDNFTQRAHEVLLKTQQGIRDLDDLMTRNEIFMARCQNIGNFSAEKAIAVRPQRPHAARLRRQLGPAARRAVLHLRPLQVPDPRRQLRRRLRPLPRPSRRDATVGQHRRAGARATAARWPDRAGEDATPPAHAPGRGLHEGGGPARRVGHLPGVEGRRQAVPAEDALALHSATFRRCGR